VRDQSSTYVSFHSPGWVDKEWNIVPTLSAYGGLAFYIVFAHEEYTGYDGVDQTGWSLSAVRRLASDIVSSTETNAMIHASPEQSNTFVLTPVLSGDTFLISLARDDLTLDGIDQTGWYLDVGAIKTDPSDSEDTAYHAVFHPGTPAYSYAVRFAQ